MALQDLPVLRGGEAGRGRYDPSGRVQGLCAQQGDRPACPQPAGPPRGGTASFIKSFPFQTSMMQKLEIHGHLQYICDLTVGIKLSKVRRDFNTNYGYFVLLGK